MDLSKLDLSEAASRAELLQLKHPATGEDLFTDDGDPIVIELLGADCEEYRKAMRVNANKRINNRKKLTVEQLEQQGIVILAAVTKGWDGLLENGEIVEFSESEARKLYTAYPWIREQVDEFVGDRSNFLDNA